MVELAPAGQGLLRQGFAGDTFNTAWYLKRLCPDWSVDYVSAVGSDALSQAMVDFMAGAGIGTDHVARRAEQTVGLYLISLKDGERAFTYWRGQSAARTLADDPEALARALTGAGLVVFSGITLAILAPDRRAGLLEALRRCGAVVAFDPNMRAGLWSSPADMADWMVRAAAVADIVLPSFDEAAGLWGDAAPEETLARWRDMGPGTVVVKNGGGRIWAWDHAGVVSFDPSAVVAVDTTAAGDSFNAGFLAARLGWAGRGGAGLGGAGLLDCLRAGAGLAGRVIMATGALVAGVAVN